MGGLFTVNKLEIARARSEVGDPEALQLRLDRKMKPAARLEGTALMLKNTLLLR